MLRKINLSAIMNYIRIAAPISRSTIARKTGLNKATITSLVAELINQEVDQRSWANNQCFGSSFDEPDP